MSDAIVKRLEAVAAKLEAFAAGNAGAAAAASSSSSSGSAAGPSAGVVAYDAFYASAAQPFIDAANAVEGSKAVVSSSNHRSSRATDRESERVPTVQGLRSRRICLSLTVHLSSRFLFVCLLLSCRPRTPRLV